MVQSATATDERAGTRTRSRTSSLAFYKRKKIKCRSIKSERTAVRAALRSAGLRPGLSGTVRLALLILYNVCVCGVCVRLCRRRRAYARLNCPQFKIVELRPRAASVELRNNDDDDGLALRTLHAKRLLRISK